MNKRRDQEMQRRGRQSRRDARKRHNWTRELQKKILVAVKTIPLSDLWPNMSRRERVAANLLSGDPAFTPIGYSGYRLLAEAAMERVLR